MVKCFPSSIAPVCSQPSHVANGDGFWVEMCLIPGFYPATLCGASELRVLGGGMEA